jgi:putative transposase
VRYATWDLSHVQLSDPKTGTLLCRLYPQDKAKNAEGIRPYRQSPQPAQAQPQEQQATANGMAPLLEKILRDYATTGLPPAYLPGPDPSEISTNS